MAITDLPIKENIMVALRQGKGLSKERYKELTDEGNAAGKAAMEAMRLKKKEINANLKAFFQEVKQLAIDIAKTIPIIMAALSSPFSAPAVPGQAMAFATYILNVVRRTMELMDKVNTMIEEVLGIQGGLAGLAGVQALLPDWFTGSEFSGDLPDPADLVGLTSEADSASSEASAQESSSKELSEVTDGFQTGVADDSERAREVIDWSTWLGNTAHSTLQYTHPITDPPSATGYTPEFTLVGINIPGYATTAEWTASKVTGTDVPLDNVDVTKSRIWLYEMSLKGGSVMGAGQDYTSEVICDARFIPDPHPVSGSYLDDRKGTWGIGIGVAANKTRTNFGNNTELHLEMKWYPKAKGPASIKTYVLKKMFIFKLS